MRKTVDIVLNDRGTEKTFVIQEMSCIQSQAWVLEAANILVKSGLLNAAEGIKGGNLSLERVVAALMEGALSKLSSLDSEGAQALLLKLLACCSYKKDAQQFPLNNQANVEQYIDDLRTLARLEAEALKVNFDFFTDASHSTSQDKQPNTSKKQVSKA